jgi:molybdopterin/thiamine biosynthesis adenylyltransferase/molybdopterin synthase catalytic subunit/rhodanese-related sulfurtransferase
VRPFSFSKSPLDVAGYRAAIADATCGGYASFEGWVRDHNEGRQVRRLEYEAFEALAVSEGERIVAEAVRRFGVTHAACVHRVGNLGLGEIAVWVGVSARHRGEAFAACRYIIDEVKHRVPIWKKELYVDGDSGWVNCERCAQPAAHELEADAVAEVEHAHAHGHGHGHAHGHGRAPGHAPAQASTERDRRRADKSATAAPDYSRQIALPEVGEAGQTRLQRSSVLVIGAGGLGVPVLQYLAAAGVGRLGIADADVVEASNLQRQPLYGTADVGKLKAGVAAERVRALNPSIAVDVHAERASGANIGGWLGRYDLVVDCSDNFATKFLVNDAAVIAGKPAVFASVYQYEGQLQVYLPREDWPCLRCLWPEAPRDGLVGNCAQAGVLGPVPAALGSMQAMQALKILLGLPADSRPAVHTFDLLGMHWHTFRATRNPACDHGARSLAEPTIASDDVELEFPSLADARASGLTLVDIRESYERALDDPARQIERHVPLSTLVEGSAALAREDRYLIVCAHGVRSLALAEHLRSLGYESVYSLAGGLAALDV